jgi:hypothetical protein
MKRMRDKYELKFKQLRKLVLERDGRKCVKCGSVLSLEVHHVEGFMVEETDSMFTLCYLCHAIAPMGLIEFGKWMKSGVSGLQMLRARMAANGFGWMRKETVLGFLETLNQIGYELRTSQLRLAREHRKKVHGRGQGIAPFGMLPGESETLEKIVTMRQTMIADKIAVSLNESGILSRSGTLWRGSTIRKILDRERRSHGERKSA